MRVCLICLLLALSAPAAAADPPLDVNRATSAALHARLPARLVEPITKYRAFYGGRFVSVDQVIESLSKMSFGAFGCGADACPEKLTDAERALLRTTLVVKPR